MTCEHRNPSGYAFCGTCGDRLDCTVCRCGFHNTPGQIFCGRCGHSLALQSDIKEGVTNSVPGKYNLHEFMSTVEIQKKHDEDMNEQGKDGKGTDHMNQDDIANLFGNIGGDDQ